MSDDDFKHKLTAKTLRDLADRVEAGEVAIVTYSAYDYDHRCCYGAVQGPRPLLRCAIAEALLGMDEVRAVLLDTARNLKN